MGLIFPIAIPRSRFAGLWCLPVVVDHRFDLLVQLRGIPPRLKRERFF